MDSPCGIEITTRKIDACQLVRGALGNAGQQFITKADAMCQCLPKALKMVTTASFESIRTGSDVSTSVSSIIGEVVELQKVSDLLINS